MRLRAFIVRHLRRKKKNVMMVGMIFHCLESYDHFWDNGNTFFIDGTDAST